MYRTERYDAAAAPELMYSFTVPNGSYLVRLHFADTYSGNQAVGARVFDVDIEGQLVFNHIDIFAGGRGQCGLDPLGTTGPGRRADQHPVPASDENPLINAIEIIQQLGRPRSGRPCGFHSSTLSGVAPLSVVFDGSSSTDPDGTVVGYSWDFGDRTSGSSAVLAHVYSTPGLVCRHVDGD